MIAVEEALAGEYLRASGCLGIGENGRARKI